MLSDLLPQQKQNATCRSIDTYKTKITPFNQCRELDVGTE